MTVSVDITDRLYDYTDEEKAADAVAQFQTERNLDDEAIVSLWDKQGDPLRNELERRIINAVDSNGSVKRANESVPSEIFLFIDLDKTP